LKILVLIGSGRKDGNTARVVDLIREGLITLAEQAGERLETENLFLNDLDIRSCRGCRLCFVRGEESCPLKDDIPGIRAKIDASDGLVLASPVYVNDVSGQMKTLIDRLAYVCHRPAFAGKCALLLATVAGSTVNHTLRTLDIALRTWGVHISAKAGFKMGALMSREEVEQRFGHKAVKTAGRFFQDLRQKAIPETIISVPHGIQNSAALLEEGAAGRTGLSVLV